MGPLLPVLPALCIAGSTSCFPQALQSSGLLRHVLSQQTQPQPPCSSTATLSPQANLGGFPNVGGLDGIRSDLAAYIRELAQIVAEENADVSIRVVSGYRSPEYQSRLRAQWDSGNRAGLVVRPAVRSRHSDGLAVDLAFSYKGYPIPVRDTPRQYWQYLAEILAPVGVIWGGTFRSPDVNHFEIRAR